MINDDVKRCSRDVQAIVTAERLHRERQPYLMQFVRELVERP